METKTDLVSSTEIAQIAASGLADYGIDVTTETRSSLWCMHNNLDVYLANSGPGATEGGLMRKKLVELAALYKVLKQKHGVPQSLFAEFDAAMGQLDRITADVEGLLGR